MVETAFSDKYDVRLWFVANTIEQGSVKRIHARLSPEFTTREKARKAYRELKKTNP